MPYEEFDIHNRKYIGDLSVRLQHARSWIDECRIEHRCEEPLELGSKHEGNTIYGELEGAYTPKASSIFSQQYLTSQKLPQLPRRILDIRDFGEKKKLRLLEGSDIKGTYACLSYCWGPRNSCVTTITTIEQYLVDIPWDSLPQTYKDAVFVASTLKVPYLWIDALCIIQDDYDQRDWKEQSAQMADIYGNSWVTIAVGNSSGVSEGFLKNMEHFPEPFVFEAPSPCSLDTSTSASTRTPNSSHSTVYARRVLDLAWLVSSYWNAKDKIATNPLWSRGWCFQEEFLATRVLGFYGIEMIFQCREGHRCECKLRNRDPPGCCSLRSMKSELLAPFHNLPSPYTANALWQFIIHDYGRRKLTFIKDRLPALSGVARIVQSLFQTRYLAGHWDDNTLLFSLCWSATSSTPEPRFAIYVAPSWSWAAFPASVTRNNPLHDDYTLVKGTKVLAAETTLDTDDPTGAVLAGYLVVRGVFLDVEVVKTNDGRAMRRKGVDIDFVLDQEPHPSDLAAKSPRVVCWYICNHNFGGGERCFWLIILEVIQDHPRRICKRIGYREFCCNAANRQGPFFEGYRSCLGVSGLI